MSLSGAEQTDKRAVTGGWGQTRGPRPHLETPLVNAAGMWVLLLGLRGPTLTVDSLPEAAGSWGTRASGIHPHCRTVVT